MSQTNHICVSLDFYGIDRHLESLLLPLQNIVGGKGRGGERGSGADFSENCAFLLIHLSRRVVYEEIRKDEGYEEKG